MPNLKCEECRAVKISNRFNKFITLFTCSASSNYLCAVRFKPTLREASTLRVDYAIIGFAIILLAGSMYLAGLSLQMTDLAARVETVKYATYLFVASIVLIIFMVIISIVKKALLKPE